MVFDEEWKGGEREREENNQKTTVFNTASRTKIMREGEERIGGRGEEIKHAKFSFFFFFFVVLVDKNMNSSSESAFFFIWKI